MDPGFSLVIGMEILVRPMSKDFPAWRRGQLGKSRREEKLHSLHDVGLYYWKPGVLCYFIIVFLGRKLSVTFFFFFWEAAMVILDGAEVGTGLRT